MTNNNIKKRIREVVEETLKGITFGKPKVEVTCASDLLTDDEKLVNEVMEEHLDGTFHVETTFQLVKPIEYINITFKLNE